MAGNVRRDDRTAWCGDSVTQFGYMSVAGGLVDQINNRIGSSQVGPRRVKGTGLGAFPTVGGKAGKLPGGAITVINRGVAGWKVAQVQADAAATISQAPNVIFLCIGINDAVGGVTPPATYRTSLDATLDAYIVGLPGVVIFVISPFLFKEQWTHVGPALNNSDDANIDLIVAQAQASAAARPANCTWVPLRPAALAYEVANNTPEPGAVNGILMDGTSIHPTIPLGQLFMSNQIMQYVTVVP